MCNTHFILGEGTQEGASLRTGESGNRKSADDANQLPRTKVLALTPAKPREGICSCCCTAQGGKALVETMDPGRRCRGAGVPLSKGGGQPSRLGQ